MTTENITIKDVIKKYNIDHLLDIYSKEVLDTPTTYEMFDDIVAYHDLTIEQIILEMSQFDRDSDFTVKGFKVGEHYLIFVIIDEKNKRFKCVRKLDTWINYSTEKDISDYLFSEIYKYKNE